MGRFVRHASCSYVMSKLNNSNNITNIIFHYPNNTGDVIIPTSHITLRSRSYNIIYGRNHFPGQSQRKEQGIITLIFSQAIVGCRIHQSLPPLVLAGKGTIYKRESITGLFTRENGVMFCGAISHCQKHYKTLLITRVILPSFLYGVMSSDVVMFRSRSVVGI